ncbi:MAG TPA: hypothetical protein VMH06_04400, partial [Thermodesulfovibrionales bacterium]|nr:hypothetical protein [Thermodesulfovibrionales bacterium]
MADKLTGDALRGIKDIINQLAVIIRTAQIHDPGNVAVVTAIDRLLAAVNPLVSSETLSIELVGEYFYANEGRVRYSMEYLLNFD